MRQNLAGSFNNISLNIKFWKKYNLRKPRLCFRISQGVPEWNSNEWSKLLYFYAVQILRRNSGVYVLKVPQGDDEWNSKRKKDTKRENPRKTSPSVKYITLNINL